MARSCLILALALLAPSAPAADTHLLVVSGISGDAVYRELFDGWSQAMLDAAEHALGLPRSRVTYLTEEREDDEARGDGPSRKVDVDRSIGEIAARAGPGDRVMIVLIGHGNVRDKTAVFNLPGPDIEAAELAAWLERLSAQTVVLVNTSPSSGPFIRALSGPNRVIITATESASEDNHTVFADHFISALAGQSADTDKNGRVSILEAFNYARREVKRAYESDGLLLTEHAMLDDNGDGKGSLAPGSEGPDGEIAHRVFLGFEPVQVVRGESPELDALVAERDAIRLRIETLTREKAQLEPEIYENRLEDLLVELALNRRAIREAETEQ